jgi:hypothetical protein
MLVLGVLSMTIRVFALQRSPIKATYSFSASLTLLEVSVWEDATICSTAAKSFCKTLARPWDSYPESFAGYVNVGSLTLALSKKVFPGSAGLWNTQLPAQHAYDRLAFCISWYFPFEKPKLPGGFSFIQGSKWIQRGGQDYANPVCQQVASLGKPGSGGAGGEELWVSIFPTQLGTKEPLV